MTPVLSHLDQVDQRLFDYLNIRSNSEPNLIHLLVWEEFGDPTASSPSPFLIEMSLFVLAIIPPACCQQAHTPPNIVQLVNLAFQHSLGSLDAAVVAFSLSYASREVLWSDKDLM